MPTAKVNGPAPLIDAEPLFRADAMRAADQAAHEDHRIPSIVLMERAGLATARAIIERYPPGRAVVLAGSGNNGGDGLVVARHLREAGYTVCVVCPAGEPRTDDAATNARIAASLGIPVLPFEPSIAPPDLIVDAMLGTGARGEPRGATLLRSVIHMPWRGGRLWNSAANGSRTVRVGQPKGNPNVRREILDRPAKAYRRRGR